MKRATGKSNLDIVKDYVEGNRPFIQVGYDPNLNNSKRKEGEEWEDGQGNKWVWKNGSKRKVSKLGQIKIDQRCSICNADMKFGNYLDDRFFPKTGKCYDCAISFDSKLKSLGVYADYEKLKSNVKDLYKRRKNLKDNLTNLDVIDCYDLVFNASELNKLDESDEIILVYNFKTLDFIVSSLDIEILNSKVFIVASNRILEQLKESRKNIKGLKVYVADEPSDLQMLKKASSFI